MTRVLAPATTDRVEVSKKIKLIAHLVKQDRATRSVSVDKLGKVLICQDGRTGARIAHKVCYRLMRKRRKLRGVPKEGRNEAHSRLVQRVKHCVYLRPVASGIATP